LLDTVLFLFSFKMVEPIFDYQFRIITIGDSTVGKSSLLKYFTDGKFAEVHFYGESETLLFHNFELRIVNKSRSL
jgi:GTPase SAR1 family protein